MPNAPRDFKQFEEATNRMNSPNDEPFLAASDVARVVGLTPAAVRLAARTGRLRVAAMTRSGIHLFLLEDVERFVADRRSRGGALRVRSNERSGDDT